MANKPPGCLPSTLKRLVWALKCLGLLCFKRSPSPAASGRGEISVPLLLWAIFLKTLQMTQIVNVAVILKDWMSSVGHLTTMLALIVFLASVVMGQISIIINGPVLCDILSECEADACLKEARWSIRRSSMERIMAILYYFSNGTIVFTFILNAFYAEPGPQLYQYILSCLYFCPHFASTTLTVMLFREVLTIASSKLSVDFLALDEYRTDAEGSNPCLYSLERKIHKMEFLRGKIVDCFLTAISLMMCTATFIIIVILFAIIKYLVVDISLNNTLTLYASFVMTNILTLVHLCYSGHYFSQHMRHVSGQLRELRMEVSREKDMIQLQYLISTLERMETFDMGSWYCLSTNTLVSVVSFVLTYLVVLLQVGGQSTSTK